MHAVAEASRNVASSGARPIAATNCLNFGSPEKPEVMWQFSEVIDGLSTACTELGTPITGGNVSFYNETLGKSIYPTPVIGVLGVLDDASRVLKIAFRNEGDLIVLLDGASVEASAVGARHAVPSSDAARTTDVHSLLAREFCSSEYSKSIAGVVSGEPPAIDLAAEKRLQDCLVALAAESAVQSAHDVSDGGLAVTIAESCFAANGFSALVSLVEKAPAEAALFGERGARAVVSVSPGSIARLREFARQYNVQALEVGRVTCGSEFCIEFDGRSVINSSIETLRDAWANSLELTLKNK
jgi:phosphoribosylformylglycinamidine synthase